MVRYIVRLRAIKLVSVLSMISSAVGLPSPFSLSSSESDPSESEPLPEPDDEPSESEASLPRISLLRPLYLSSLTAYSSSNLKASENIENGKCYLSWANTFWFRLRHCESFQFNDIKLFYNYSKSLYALTQHILCISSIVQH